MPTYQYVCTDCGTDLEAVQSFSDPSLTECPTCGGKLRKKFGAVGVVFKGSGFYRTDSRSDRGGSSEKTPAKAESSTSSSASTDSGSSGSSSPTPASGASSSGSSSSSSTSSTSTSSAA